MGRFYTDTFYTDNAASVDIINKATSRDVTVMIFVRRLVLACLKYNILFRARHVPGVKNVLADKFIPVTGFEVQTASSSGCTTITSSHTRSTTTTQLANITSELLQSSLQPSSIPTYRRAWNLYSQFSNVVFHTALVNLPISPSNLGLFVAYMFQRHYAASTANTYISALGYYHRLAGVPDPTKVFRVIEMLKG